MLSNENRSPPSAMGVLECADWLDVKANDHTRRTLLSDPQHASAVRRDARIHRKSEKLSE